MSSWIKSTAPKRRYFVSNPDNDSITHNTMIYNIKSNRVCLVPHFGLGDLICMIPAINYLSTIYDQVKVICLEKNINNIKTFFLNNTKIIFLVHNKFMSHTDIYPFNEKYYNDDLIGYDILRA